MKRKLRLGAIGLLLLFAGPALAELLNDNPEAPIWQVLVCLAITGAGGIVLDRATTKKPSGMDMNYLRWLRALMADPLFQRYGDFGSIKNGYWRAAYRRGDSPSDAAFDCVPF